MGIGLFLSQSPRGIRGNLEIIHSTESGEQFHYFFHNQADPVRRWHGPFRKFSKSVGSNRFSLVTSIYGNHEMLVREADRLAHYWWGSRHDSIWNFSSYLPGGGASGTPAMIQGKFGNRGNFEVVCPLASGGLGHWWRDNDRPDYPWHGPFQVGFGTVEAVSLLQSNFGTPGNLEVVALVEGQLWHYYRDQDQDWHGPFFVGDGVTGQPGFIQSTLGHKGHFYIVAPLREGLGCWLRNNDRTPYEWTFLDRFGRDAVAAAALVQSSIQGRQALHAIAIGDSRLYHYSSASGLLWTGGIANSKPPANLSHERAGVDCPEYQDWYRMHENGKNRKRFVDRLPDQYPWFANTLDRCCGLKASSFATRCSRPQPPPFVWKSNDDKLKILLITLLEFPVQYGLTNYLLNLQSGLRTYGHTVDTCGYSILGDRESEAVETMIKRKLIAYCMNRYGYYDDMALNILSMIGAFELIADEMLDLEQYDLFHAHDRFAAIALGNLSRKYRKPLFYTLHSFNQFGIRRAWTAPVDQDEMKTAFFQQIDKQAISNVHKAILLADCFKPRLFALGAAPDKLTTVHTGIRFPVLPRSSVERPDVVVTCVSRLEKFKGQLQLIEALAAIRSELDNVKVRIVGDGPLRQELEQRTLHHQLHQVTLLGNRDDIANLLSESDIFVHPTLNDTLPIVVLEAMFARQAIVTTACGGLPEIIRQDVTGILVEPGNVAQLAQKLLLLIRDKQLRSRLADNAFQYANEHLTREKMAEKVSEVYRSLSKQ